MREQGPGEVLFSFVRHWSRRPPTEDARGEQGRLVLVSEAVHALGHRKIRATVNAVAHEIGIDQSGASRLIKNAAAAGYLVLTAASSDARQREVSLTPEGRSLLDDAHRWQEGVFGQLTAGWSAKRRHDFQQAMTDLIERSGALEG